MLGTAALGIMRYGLAGSRSVCVCVSYRGKWKKKVAESIFLEI